MSQKRTVADAEKHANARAIVICHNEIGLQVAVEVCYDNGFGADSSWIIHLCLESAIAVVEQDARGVSKHIAGNQVCFTVSVEVARCHVLRPVPRGILGGNEESLRSGLGNA